MKIKQISEIVNKMAADYVGETDLQSVDMGDIVTLGQTITNAIGYEQFTNTLVDRIGEVIMVNREYQSTAPDILRRGTGIPYGSITEKIRVKLPQAVNNDSWAVGETWTPGAGWSAGTNPTNDNANPFITVRPEVEVSFFNGGGTFETEMTFPRMQNQSAFTSAAELQRFADMVENRIFQARTVFKDTLTMTVIRNLICEKLIAGNAVIDLLAMYNTAYSQSLTPAAAIYSKDFLRYAGYVMSLFPRRLGKMSRRYNTQGYDTFTPVDRLRFVALDMFTSAIETFMTSDTYHDDLVGLKQSYTPVDCWQGAGNGDGINFATAATIQSRTASGVDVVTNHMAAEEGPVYIVGVMFDVEAAWQRYDFPRTTSQWNARKEQTTFFYKQDVSFANDLAENCVVFTLGTPATTNA